jgi:hypothetical protein
MHLAEKARQRARGGAATAGLILGSPDRVARDVPVPHHDVRRRTGQAHGLLAMAQPHLRAAATAALHQQRDHEQCFQQHEQRDRDRFIAVAIPERRLAETNDTAGGKSRFVDSPPPQLARIEDRPRLRRRRIDHGTCRRARKKLPRDRRTLGRDLLQRHRVRTHGAASHDVVDDVEERRRARRGEPVIDGVRRRIGLARAVAAKCGGDYHRLRAEPTQLPLDFGERERREDPQADPGRQRRLADELLERPVDLGRSDNGHELARLGPELEGELHGRARVERRVDGQEIRWYVEGLDRGLRDEAHHRHAGEHGIPMPREEAQPVGFHRHQDVETLPAVAIPQEFGETLFLGHAREACLIEIFLEDLDALAIAAHEVATQHAIEDVLQGGALRSPVEHQDRLGRRDFGSLRSAGEGEDREQRRQEAVRQGPSAGLAACIA